MRIFNFAGDATGRRGAPLSGDIIGRVYHLVIPDAPLNSEQLRAIQAAIELARQHGIDVIITIGR